MKSTGRKSSSGKEMAAALAYQTGAPRVVAKGTGEIARKIIEEAESHGIPIQKNEPLVEALMHVELTKEIPPELYQTVAEILAFIYRLDQAAGKKRLNTE